MAELRLETIEGVTLRQELAGGGSRFGAALVDLSLFGLTWLVIALLATAVAAVDGSGASALLRGALLGGLPLGFALFEFLLLVRYVGRTPGKRLFGLRVVADDGYPAGNLQLALRSALLLVDVLPVPLPLGLFVILGTRSRQRLGDLVAGTAVVREGRAWRRAEPFPGETWSTLPTRSLDLIPGLAARLDDEDVALLRELASRRGLRPAQARRLEIRAAGTFAARLELGRIEDPRRALKELYLFAREARGGFARGARPADEPSDEPGGAPGDSAGAVRAPSAASAPGTAPAARRPDR